MTYNCFHQTIYHPDYSRYTATTIFYCPCLIILIPFFLVSFYFSLVSSKLQSTAHQVLHPVLLQFLSKFCLTVPSQIRRVLSFLLLLPLKPSPMSISIAVQHPSAITIHGIIFCIHPHACPSSSSNKGVHQNQ